MSQPNMDAINALNNEEVGLKEVFIEFFKQHPEYNRFYQYLKREE